MVKELTYQNFDKEIKKEMPVVVEFYSPTCAHCRQLEVSLNELSEELAQKAFFAKCNIAAEEALTAQWDITSVPTLLFLKDGEAKEKLIGYTHKLIIAENIKKL